MWLKYTYHGITCKYSQVEYDLKCPDWICPRCKGRGISGKTYCHRDPVKRFAVSSRSVIGLFVRIHVDCRLY